MALNETEQTFDTVQDYVEHRREQRAEAAEAETVEEVDEDQPEEIETEVEETEVDEEISEDDPSEEEIEDTSDEDSDDDDEPEVDEAAPVAPVVDPPRNLKGDEREAFSKLQPEAQKLVVDLAKSGEAVVTRKTQELNQTRQLFESRMEGLDGFISETEQAVEYYETRDWQAAYNQCETAEQLAYVNAEKARADALKAQLTEAKQKRGQAEVAEHRVFVQQRTTTLTELAQSDNPIAKALLDPKDGIDRQKEVFSYMQKSGIEHDTLMWIPAEGLTMAYKAMMYDKGNEKAKALPTKQRTQAKPAAKVVKSTPSGVQGSSTGKRLKQLQSKSELSHTEHRELLRLERSRKK